MRVCRLLVSLACILLVSACAVDAAGARTVIGWRFDTPGDLKGWAPGGGVEDVRVADGCLSARTTGSDPIIQGPTFDIAASANQWVELVVRSDKPGEGQVYWSNTLDSPYGGYLPEKVTNFSVPGGNEWRTLRIYPFWQAEKRIIHIRIDPPSGVNLALKSIRIAAPADGGSARSGSAWDFRSGSRGWWSMDGSAVRVDKTRGLVGSVTCKDSILASPSLNTALGDLGWVAVTMRVSKGNRASLIWATDKALGRQTLAFPVRNDGRFHTYNLDMGGAPNWTGKLLMLGVRPSFENGAQAEVRSVALTRDASGPADLYLQWFGLENPVNRVGADCPLTARFINYGARTASGLKAKVTAPPGVVVVPAKGAQIPVFDLQVPAAFRFTLRASRPVEGEIVLKLTGPGAPEGTFRTPIHITADPGLRATNSVPTPVPAKTPYRLGMYYFPGWDAASKWECIERVAPWRKPVLGYYDESNPECADWQIKWAVEHGITFFLVDWYWSDGQRMLEHWLNNAYSKSKYRSYLQWAVMWANHNAPGTHSAEDWRKVTQFWIDNYFGMKEYMRMDGMPAVYMWSISNLREDVGGSEKLRALIAMSQEMAHKAGYPGIKFVAMNISGSTEDAKTLAYEGFSANTEYHWWGDALSVADDPYYLPYSLVVQRSRAAWDARAKAIGAGGLEFIPVADSGWDPQPWHGLKSNIIYGRTPALWEKLLRDAKSYMDERGQKTLVLGPCNEWGEGSYLEPCAEWGFGMYDAVRRVFCEEPAAHMDLVPSDVGLGPYDLPMVTRPLSTSWTFGKDGDTEGWSGMMGLRDVTVKDGSLRAVTSNSDPAFGGPSVLIDAAKYDSMEITMRVSPEANSEDFLQLFWGTATQEISAATSAIARLIPDGEFHTYVVPVSTNSNWRGRVRALRLDPCSRANVELEISDIRFTPRKP